jgi:cell division protein FtsB
MSAIELCEALIEEVAKLKTKVEGLERGFVAFKLGYHSLDDTEEKLDYYRFLSDLADEKKRNAELEHSNTILKNRLEEVKKAVRL